MSRPLFPPHFVNLNVAILRDPKITPAVFRFYAMLRALAWGEDTLRINVNVLSTATGLNRSCVFGYARSLRLRNALLWCCAEDVFECLFTVPSDDEKNFSSDPKTSDLLIPETLKEITEKTPKNSESENFGFAPKATAAQVCETYTQLLGYTPANLARGETKAAKWIGQRYSLAELEAAYRYYKAQPFWHDKPLTLRQLQTLLPEYLLAKGRTHATPVQPDDPGQLERDLRLKAGRSDRAPLE